MQRAVQAKEEVVPAHWNANTGQLTKGLVAERVAPIGGAKVLVAVFLTGQD